MKIKIISFFIAFSFIFSTPSYALNLNKVLPYLTAVIGTVPNFYYLINGLVVEDSTLLSKVNRASVRAISAIIVAYAGPRVTKNFILGSAINHVLSATFLSTVYSIVRNNNSIKKTDDGIEYHLPIIYSYRNQSSHALELQASLDAYDDEDAVNALNHIKEDAKNIVVISFTNPNVITDKTLDAITSEFDSLKYINLNRAKDGATFPIDDSTNTYKRFSDNALEQLTHRIPNAKIYITLNPLSALNVRMLENIIKQDTNYEYTPQERQSLSQKIPSLSFKYSCTKGSDYKGAIKLFLSPQFFVKAKGIIVGPVLFIEGVTDLLSDSFACF